MTEPAHMVVWVGAAMVALAITGCSIKAGTSGTQFQCDDTERCPTGFDCELGFCVSADPNDCTPLLDDDFDDGERANQWDVVERAGATIAETDGSLVITPSAAMSVSEAAYESNRLFNLANRRLVVEVPQMLNTGAADGANMLVNGDFSTMDLPPWELLTFDTGASTPTVEAGELRIAIQDGGAAVFSVQVVQAGLLLEQGETYVVHFHGRAISPRTFEALVSEGVTPFATYLQQTVNLTTTMDAYTFEFVMTAPTDTNARFDLNVGTSTVNVFFDDIEIYKKGDDPQTQAIARLRAGGLSSSDYLFIGQQGGQLIAGQQTPGGQNVLGTVDYDPVEHRFWQLRDADGATAFETSPDGTTWTTHASVPTSATNVGATIDLNGTADNLATDPGQLQFDNVRLLPAGCD